MNPAYEQQRRLLDEQAIVQRERRPAPAFLLCIFLGTFGVHRFCGWASPGTGASGPTSD
jgi:hypothetical protein